MEQPRVDVHVNDERESEERLMDDKLSLSHSSDRSSKCCHYRCSLLAIVVVLVVLTYLVLHTPTERDGRSPIPLQLLLSVDDRPSSTIRKIDEQAVYTPFETIVVLQRARTDLHPAYLRAHQVIASNYARLLAPLPVDSYHVTLSGVFDRRQTADVTAYNRLITANHERLERLVHTMDHLPATDAPLTFALLDVVASGTGLTLHLRPKQPRDEQCIEWLAALANTTLGPLYKRQKQWHLTLAYKVPPIDAIVESELQRAVDELRAVFAGVDIVVRTPTLCVSPTVAVCTDLH